MSFWEGDHRGPFGGGGCFVLVCIAALRGVVEGVTGRGGEALANNVGAVRFDNEFELAGEKGTIAIVNVIGKQKTEFFMEAGFELLLPVVKGLLDLDEFDDGVDF